MKTTKLLSHIWVFIPFPPLLFLFCSLIMGGLVLSPIHLEVDQEVTQVYERHCLMGKILLHRAVDRALVKSFTQSEWKCKRMITVSEINRNMFIFTFQDQQDLAHVLENRPWTIMGGLLMLAKCTSGEVPTQLEFAYSPFWVQVHGLPLNYLTLQNGCKIGALLGLFVHTDWETCNGNTSWRRFMRLKVVLNARKPLLTGFWLKRCGLPDTWIDFKYENLGVFCYKCGRIGYGCRTCKFPSEHGRFGPWLRAAGSGRLDHEDAGGAHPARLKVVYSRVDQNVCTTLLAVPKAKAMFDDETPDLQDLPSERVCETVEFEQTQWEGESVPTRKLLQRVIWNSIDSVILLANCAIFFTRNMSVDASKDNWKLFVVMATYLSHLICKFICLNWDFRFLKAKNRLLQILILIMFLVMLVSC